MNLTDFFQIFLKQLFNVMPLLENLLASPIFFSYLISHYFQTNFSWVGVSFYPLYLVRLLFQAKIDTTSFKVQLKFHCLLELFYVLILLGS